MQALKKKQEVVVKNIREGILEFEDMLSTCEGAVKGDSDLCPLTHKFTDGIYVREIHIPAGIVLTGKIHLHSHPNFLMKGKVKVYTEFGGAEILEAPLAMISQAGTKRIVESITPVIWITIHHNPTNTQDLNELEKIVIAPSYEEFEKFVESKKSLKHKIVSGFKKFLNKIDN